MNIARTIKMRSWIGIFSMLVLLFMISEGYGTSAPKSITPTYLFVNDVYVGPVGFTDLDGQVTKPTAAAVTDPTSIDPDLNTTLSEGKAMVTFTYGLNGIMWASTGTPIYSGQPVPELSSSALQDISRAMPKAGELQRRLIRRYVGSIHVTNITYQSIAFINQVTENLAEIAKDRMTTSLTEEPWKARGFNYGATNVSDKILVIYVTPEALYAHFNYHFGAYMIPGDTVVGSGKQYIESIGVSEATQHKTIPKTNTSVPESPSVKLSKPYSPKEIVSSISGTGTEKATLILAPIPEGLNTVVTKRSESGLPSLEEFRVEAMERLSEAKEIVAPFKLVLEPGAYFVWIKTSVPKNTKNGQSLLLMGRNDTCVMAPYRIRFPYVEDGRVIHLLDRSFEGRSPFPKDQAVAIVAFPRAAEAQMDVYKVYAVLLTAGAQTEVVGNLKYSP